MLLTTDATGQRRWLLRMDRCPGIRKSATILAAMVEVRGKRARTEQALLEHQAMSRPRSKKRLKHRTTANSARWLGSALAGCKKGELVDVLIELAREDRTLLRQLVTHFNLETPASELVAATRQAIADATAFDEREINRNFSYDAEAYLNVQHNLKRLIERGQLRTAMELSLDRMDKGSCQVEMSDEGLMTDDIESCFREVLRAVGKCDLPAGEVVAWSTEMLARDRVSFLCDQEIRALLRQFKSHQG